MELVRDTGIQPVTHCYLRAGEDDRQEDDKLAPSTRIPRGWREANGPGPAGCAPHLEPPEQPIASRDVSLLAVIGGGVAGGFLTYALTFYREHRRTAEGYRAPQRQAVADIVGATYELDSRAALSVEAVNAAIKAGSSWGGNPVSVDPDQIAPAVDEARSAAGDVVRAFELARIVLVDAQCRQALDEARRVLRGGGSARPAEPENACARLAVPERSAPRCEIPRPKQSRIWSMSQSRGWVQWQAFRPSGSRV
jgi:hypothetical protein